mmetsp:Transcript_65239/g.128720  ORF Transcript_65239/g.128720 Transcript_65239/m.128720 type:complete len:279 (+) Transcript_65239:61-897(+)
MHVWRQQWNAMKRSMLPSAHVDLYVAAFSVLAARRRMTTDCMRHHAAKTHHNSSPEMALRACIRLSSLHTCCRQRQARSSRTLCSAPLQRTTSCQPAMARRSLPEQSVVRPPRLFSIYTPGLECGRFLPKLPWRLRTGAALERAVTKHQTRRQLCRPAQSACRASLSTNASTPRSRVCKLLPLVSIACTFEYPDVARSTSWPLTQRVAHSYAPSGCLNSTRRPIDATPALREAFHLRFPLRAEDAPLQAGGGSVTHASFRSTAAFEVVVLPSTVKSLA